MPFQKLQTADLYYETFGIGEPVIFIHGSLSNGNETFQKQIPFFQSSYRCISIDLRCHGKSKGDFTGLNTEILSEDIIEFMDMLGISKAHLVGHSMGGDVAMYCALNHPEKISSVVLISDGAAVNDHITAYLERLNPENIDYQHFSKLISKLRAVYGNQWTSFVKWTIWNCSTYPVFSDKDLKRIIAPVLLIRGGLDEMVLDSEVERLRKYLPNFQYYLIEHGNHFLHSQKENYCKVNHFISTFLSE
ncbi:MAG: alpha/beta hydrolase [Ruminococcus sp.]|nr:alpha/beta hydrolase [Ruminococcus sp.]